VCFSSLFLKGVIGKTLLDLVSADLVRFNSRFQLEIGFFVFFSIRDGLVRFFSIRDGLVRIFQS